MPTTSIKVLNYPAFKLPPGYLVVDGSLWDDHVDIAGLQQGGIVAVILGLYKYYDKYGNVIGLHPNCKRILDQLAGSSLITMSYYFYWTDDDPIKEANWFVDQMKGYDIKFAWLDAEDNITIQTPQVRSERFRQFAAQVKSRFPNFGVYTNVAFMAEFAPEMNIWVGKYKAWVPQYGYPQPPGKVVMSWETLKAKYLPERDLNYILKVADGQLDVVGHQFTCYPIVPGFENFYNVGLPTDVNIFTKEFIESLGVVPPIPPDPPDPPTPPEHEDYIVTTNAINIRNAPSSASNTFVRYAYKGEVLEIVGNLTNGYVQMTDGNWAYAKYLTKIDPTPPPVVPYTDYKVTANAINIRNAPVSTAATWVRYAYQDEVLHIIDDSIEKPTNGYVQMTDGNWAYLQYLIKI